VKEFVTADDIRALAEQGERELMVREHTTLTDAALDAAELAAWTMIGNLVLNLDEVINR